MIVFDKLWIYLKNRGISTYRLRENSGIDGKTIRRLKANDNMETKTLSRICEALDCRLEDIAEFVKDREEE
ncbi:MAG: helix-turn-helix transcriptional regulator [Ruminococcaceae bacterium]|nr:helix-turn-helix transcriptional regulator [Oscillospiraceae bacterium]